MRWPLSLLFRGDRDALAPAGPPAGDPGAPGETVDPVPAAGVPARPAAWQSLPPVQRSIGMAPLTAPAVPFGRTLAGRRPADPILRPLAHDLAADGPAGLVSGIATPLVVPAVATPAGVGREGLPAVRGGHPAGGAAQRLARTSSAAALPDRPSEGPAGDAPPPVAARAAELPGSPSPRPIPVVEASAAATALAATRVGASTAPETAHAVAAVVSPAAPGTASPALQRSAAGEAPGGPPAAAPWTAAPSTAAPSITPSTGAAALPDGSSPPAGAGEHARPVQPRSLGESRRLGLGAPLPGRPGVQRTAAGPDLALARPGRAAPSAGPPGLVPPPAHRAAAAEASLPVLRLAAAGASPLATPDPGAARSGDEAPGPRPADAVGVDPGRGPEAATASVQRSAERPLVGHAGSPPAAPSGDGGDAPQFVGEPGEGRPQAAGTAIREAPAGRGDAGAPEAAAGLGPDNRPASGATAAGPSAESRDRAAPPGQPTDPRSGPAARSVPLVVARSMRASTPLGSSVAGATGHVAAAAGAAPPPAPGTFAIPRDPGTAGPGPGGLAAGWQVARAAADEAAGPPAGAGAPPPGASLPLARAVVAPLPPGPAGPVHERVSLSRLAEGQGPPPSPAPVLGWSAAGGFAAGPPPGPAGPAVVQRAVAIDEVATQVAEAPAAGAAAAGPGGGGAAGAGQDDEEIADRVYDRIRSRLATELLLDRERMGLLIDG